MRFYIYTGNHGNSNAIADTVMMIKCGLQDCGHTAYISPWLMPGHVNILIEHFIDEKSMIEVVSSVERGARIVVIGTEPITGSTFNESVGDGDSHYGNRDYWKVRFDAFRMVAAAAEAVWVLAESMVATYSELLPNTAVRFLPHGAVSGFASVQQRPESERDIDFFFSGSMTEYRKGILRELARGHKLVYCDQATPEYLRQDYLSRAKVCLSIRLSPQNRIPSVSRMHFHVQNRSFLIHERYALPSILDPFVIGVEHHELIPTALAALDQTKRREIANHLHDQFMSALPMSRLMAPLVNELLAGSGRSRQAATRETLLAA